MGIARIVRLSSYALAVVILLLAALFIGLVNFFSVVGPLAQLFGNRIQIDGGLLFRGLYVGLPVIIFSRAITTRSPADVVLSVFAIPYFFVAIWALYRYYFGTSSLYWGDFFLLIGGTLLALVVIGDAFLAHTVEPEA